MNYLELLHLQAIRNKEKAAIVDFDATRKISYGNLENVTNKVAGKLHFLGFKKSDAIIINMDRRAEYIASFIGVIKAGMIAVNVVSEYPEERINYIKENSEAKYIITEKFFEDLGKYKDFNEEVFDEDPAVLLYTSGSTGNPKGILHTYGDFSRAINRIIPVYEKMDPEMRYLSTASLVFGANIYWNAVLSFGGTMFIASDVVRKSADNMAEFIRKNQITTAYISPAMLKMFKNTSTSLKFVVASGERVSDVCGDDYTIGNLYGMSEEYIVTYFFVDKKYDNTPIGKPLDGVEILILDELGNKLPQGQEGEICCKIESNTIYFKDPEKTAIIFEKCDDGKTIIHSGDIGYINENGDCVYTSRKDWMVKVNGQRVELLEIETQLKHNTNVKDATVHFFVDEDKQTYLVAYYVADENIEKQLRSDLEKKLPGYMIPRFFVKIDSIPKNINGKIDRKQLQAPKANDYRSEYVAPSYELEERICNAFEQVLRCDKVGINDDFFRLGGDSIKTVKLLSILNLNGLTRETVLLCRTPAEIARNYVENDNVIKHHEQIENEYPLTGSQKGVYLECINEPASTMYNIPFYIALPKNIDLKKFIDSVKDVVSSHKTFNVTFNVIDGEPKMLYEDKPIIVSAYRLSSLQARINEFVQPFDLENGPLYRFEIWSYNNNYYFAYDIHHLIFDGTSTEIFLKQIFARYAGEEIIEEELNIFDIALNEINIKESDKYKKAQEFFDNKLSGLETDSLIIPDIVEENRKVKANVLDIVSDLDTKQIENFVREKGISENTLFLYAFAYTLAKFNGAKNSLFCSVNNGRHDSRLSNSIGMFVRTLPSYFEFDENSAIDNELRNAQDYLFSVMDNDSIDMSDLVAKYDLNMGIQFVYQASMLSGIEYNNHFIENNQIKINDLAGQLQLMVHKNNSSYKVVISYLENQYSKAMIESFVEMYFNVTKQMLQVNHLADINFVSLDAKSIIDRFNNTEVEYDVSSTVVDMFRKQAKLTPENECVVYLDRKYTYSQVDELSDKLAKYLVSKGIKKETVTGILIGRSEYMVIASLGVLKAGGAYMPLDPSYPKERLNFMMQDAQAIMLIADRDLNDIIDGDYSGQRLMIDEIVSLENVEMDLDGVKPLPQDRFIMLYTSGTTGLPKGVIYEHSNVICLVDWMKRFYKYDNNSKRAVYASYGFDANVFDTYGILVSGGSLHIIPEEMRLDLLAIQKYFNENNITDCVMTTQVGRQFALMEGTASLKELSVAGEALTPLQPLNNFKLYNLYGPSEGTVLVTAYEVKNKLRNIPIGKAIDNVKLYVVDDKCRLLPVGGVGELIISGPHVTRGYLNKPDKTAESYGVNKFINQKDYERIYHTGDVVRLMPDGNIQFIGRRDMQVKIRGFRVELTEVEEVIRRYPGIKDATVVAFDDENGGKYIAGYVVGESEIDVKDLKEFIKNEKPSYMVPAIIMQIDEIPLNQNQKVNKKALPKPEYKAEDLVKPQSETQRKIFDIVAKIIGHDNFGIDSDIYDAGLSSIGTVKLNYELADAFNTTVKTSDLTQNNTIIKLEQFLTNNEENVAYEIRQSYPLTQTQNGIFIECISNSNSTIYNIPALFKVNDSVDVETLRNAIVKVIDCHPYIKTVLANDETGDVEAIRNDEAEVKVDVVEIDELPQLNELVKPYNMLNSPLYRITIYKTNNGTYLFMDLNHIIGDGTSEAILISDLTKAIKGEEIRKETYTGYELALDEKEARNSELYESAKDYYKQLLSSCEAEGLPAKVLGERDNISKHIEKLLNVDVDDVAKYCSENGISENAYFNSVFAFLLAEFSHSSQAIYTTIHNGRNDSRLQNVVTMLVKTIPVFTNIDGEQQVKDYIDSISKQLVKSMNNDTYSFAEISSTYGVKSDVIFVYQGRDYSNDMLNSEYLTLEKTLASDAKAPISFELSVVDNKYLVKFDYLYKYYDEAFVDSFIDAFDVATNNLKNSDLLKDVSILSDKALAFIDKCNDTYYKTDEITVDKVFEKLAIKYADRKAVTANGMSLTYEQLNIQANKVAHSLIECGVKCENIVGLIINRSVEALVGEIGILKAGGAFLPMPPEYPDDRINYCLENSESKLVITTEKIKDERPDLFNDDKPYVTKTIEELLNNENIDNPNVDISMNNLAYCIYTSGSTGNPKGVMIEHHNLSNFIQSYDGSLLTYDYESDNAGALGISSISFDMSLFEIWSALFTGKNFVMANENEIHDLIGLSKLMKDNNVQTICCTPSFFTNMLGVKEFEDVIRNLRSVLLGAEALPNALVNKVKTINPEIVICNGYGPTETTIGSSASLCDGIKPVLIGGPAHNYKYYAIDRFSNVMPAYAQGELIICGAGVSRGYIKLPEKNAASFFTMNDIPAYHSGDVVRLTDRGEYEFFGRSDNQVKLRGYRVELDEIEKAICAYDNIKQSKVIVRNNGNEDYLAGFFTASCQIDIDDLRSFLKSKLTSYMVPTSMMQLDKMPLNVNGKIDKKALPEIVVTNKENKQRRVPKKSTEEKLCEIFKEILGLEEYYVDDDFFEMGGTSLSASKLTMRLMADGIEVQYQDVFDNPTPELLGELIDSKNKKQEVEKVDIDERENNFEDVLKYNCLDYANNITRTDLGDVLLTGGVGFLGIHILYELLTEENGHIYCLIRKGKYDSGLDRLKKIGVYYFDDIEDEIIDNRVTIIEADVTDNDLEKILSDIKVDTIINCAAIVKHYAADDSIEEVNVGGVENLIKIAKNKDAKLIQISTTSIPGAHTEESYRHNVKMYENEHFVIDNMDNKYIISKYKAECKVFEAIRDGLRGKVIRVGNLMGRFSDGEFQVNMTTNAFLKALKGFATLGICPIGHSTDPMSYTPIDLAAKVVRLLAGTDDKFTAFHADSRYGFDEYKLIEAANRCGIEIKRIEDKEYYDKYYEMLGNNEINENLSGLVTNDRPDMHMVETDNKFTANILYRLGFEWPFTDVQYLDKTIESIKTLGFFDIEELEGEE